MWNQSLTCTAVIGRMTKKIGFVVSGPGLIGKRHCSLIQARQDSELRAIVAPDTSENRLTAQHFGVPIYSDLMAAVVQREIDAAIISSPNHCHHEQAVFCIDREIPVLVEKPLTDSIDTAKEISRLVELTGVPMLVGHHRMHSSLISSAKAFLSSDSFGRLVALNGAALFYKPTQYFKDGAWRTKKGGGPLLINLIHEIGIMRFLAGEISEVVALASDRMRQYEVEDTAAIAFRFASGALGTFVLSDTAASSKSWEMTSGENPAYPSYQEDCYHFAGTKGSLDFPTLTARSYGPNNEPSWNKVFEMEQLVAERVDPLVAQLSHFINVIRRVDVPLVSALDGYQNMLVVEAISRSLNTQSVVHIKDLE